MRRLFAFALVSALGVMAMSSIAVSLTPQPDPSAPSVNRALKGDRMAVTVVTRNAADKRDADKRDADKRDADKRNAEEGALFPSKAKPDAPVGCDPLFSPISSPRLAHLYRRCLT